MRVYPYSFITLIHIHFHIQQNNKQLTSTQGAKVLGRLGHDVGAQCHFDTSCGIPPDGNVEVADGIRPIFDVRARVLYTYMSTRTRWTYIYIYIWPDDYSFVHTRMERKGKWKLCMIMDEEGHMTTNCVNILKQPNWQKVENIEC